MFYLLYFCNCGLCVRSYCLFFYYPVFLSVGFLVESVFLLLFCIHKTQSLYSLHRNRLSPVLSSWSCDRRHFFGEATQPSYRLKFFYSKSPRLMRYKHPFYFHWRSCQPTSSLRSYSLHGAALDLRFYVLGVRVGKGGDRQVKKDCMKGNLN